MKLLLTLAVGLVTTTLAEHRIEKSNRWQSARDRKSIHDLIRSVAKI